MQVKVYEPQRQQSFIKLIAEIIIGFREGRELAWRLFVRDLKVSYSRSFLGILWLFLPPLANAGIWIFLQAQKVVSIQDTPMSYTGFALCGTLLWSTFAESMARPILRYQGAMSMMTKLNFPREAIVLASLYDMSFSYLLKVIILVPGLWIFGYPPTWSFLPALLFFYLIILVGLAIGLFLTPLGLLYNDIGKALPIVLPFAMYLTPVIYPMGARNFMAAAQAINPVTPFLERARSWFGDYAFTMQTELFWWSVILLLLLSIGLLAIRIALPVIVERAGS
jgi:lipopolysaccharide transport system permease protein